MRILMVSPYPPLRDGIASYAVQEVKALRAAGHDVEVLSPGPSAAHHHLDLRGPRGPLALAKRVRRSDCVIVQSHPDIFYPHPASERVRLAVTAGLRLAFLRARRVEVRVHEVNYDWGRDGSRHARAFRSLWRRVDEVTVHTAVWPAAGLPEPAPAGAAGAAVRGGWPVDPAAVAEVDRDAVQHEIGRRAEAARAPGPTVPSDEATATLPPGGRGGDASDALQRVPLFTVPLPTSGRRSGRLAKRVVHKATYWLMAPLVDQLNDLRRATIAGVDRAQHPGDDAD
jgi:hypothetical protein